VPRPPEGRPGATSASPAGPGIGEWRRLHPVTIIRELFRVAVNIVVAIVVLGAFQGGTVARIEIIAPVIGFAVALGRYYSTRYLITPEAVLWRRGILFRQRVEVPRNRIQNVASGADVLGRIFDLRTVTISTAGTEGEVALALVSSEESSFLLSELLGRRDPGTPGAGPPDGGEPSAGAPAASGLGAPAAPGPGAATGWDGGVQPTAAPPETRPLVALSTGQLAMYGLTGSGIGVLVAVIVFVGASVLTGNPGPLTFLLFVVAAPIMGVLDLVDFRLYGEADRIRVRHGLLRTRDKWARRERVQVLAVERPLLRSSLGYETVSVATADATVTGDATLTLCDPLAARGEWPALAAELLEPTELGEDDLRPISRRALRRRFIRVLVTWLVLLGAPVVAFAGVLAGVEGAGWAGLVAVAVGAVLAGFLAHRAQRFDGYVYDDEHLLVRRGMVASRLWLVRRAKVQSASLTANPFQRRLGLASVLVDTANVTGGTLIVPELPRADAEALAAELVRLADRVYLPDGV
jgi:putative membrane protein